MTNQDPRRAARASWTPGDRLDREHRRQDADGGAGGTNGPHVGVLALQGDVLEHVRALRRCGAMTSEVRNVDDLDAIDALVLPGGESTTIGKLLVRLQLLDAIQAKVRAGMPVFGTCAGMILLSDELDQTVDQPRIGGLAVRTRRNAFGRQRESFDTRIDVVGIDGPPMDVAFIRAPRIEQMLSDDVEVLARVGEHPVVVRQGNLLAAAFHPEVTGDDRLHHAFVEQVRRYVAHR